MWHKEGLVAPFAAVFPVEVQSVAERQQLIKQGLPLPLPQAW